MFEVPQPHKPHQKAPLPQGGAFLFRSQLAGVARALLLLSDWGFQWPSLRQAPSGPCIFEPGGVFFRDWIQSFVAWVRAEAKGATFPTA